MPLTYCAMCHHEYLKTRPRCPACGHVPANKENRTINEQDDDFTRQLSLVASSVNRRSQQR
jgi:hypothetical protein